MANIKLNLQEWKIQFKAKGAESYLDSHPGFMVQNIATNSAANADPTPQAIKRGNESLSLYSYLASIHNIHKDYTGLGTLRSQS